jgi:hypothetical protein
MKRRKEKRSNLVKIRPNLKSLKSLQVKLSEKCQTAEEDKGRSNLMFETQIQQGRV